MTVQERTLTPVEDFICTLQGELFEEMAYNGIDMAWFVPTYLSSEFCNKEMDARYSRFHTSFVGELVDFVTEEIGNLKTHPKGLFFNGDMAMWLGYTYRYLAIMTGIPSKKLLIKAQPEKLCRAYAGLHTIGDDLAFEILCNDFHLYEQKDK